MGRATRIEYPGAIYYLTNRNESRTPIFRGADDYLRFLSGLGETCTKMGWRTHAFALVPDRFRLIVETPTANLVAGMCPFLRGYTTHFNSRHHLTGELFVQRYKSKLVDGGEFGWLANVCDYAHVQPARAGLLDPAQPLREYPWSSVPLYLNTQEDRPEWLRVDRVLAQHRIAQDDVKGRTELEDHLEYCRVTRDKWLFQGIERGWYHGGYRFRDELLERQASRANGNEQNGPQPDPNEEKARRIVEEELKKRFWTSADLPRYLKADPQKLRIAQRLRTETSVALKWIARELHMGTPDYLAKCLHQANKKYQAQKHSLLPRCTVTGP